MRPDVVTVVVTRADGGISVMRVIVHEPSTGHTYDPTSEYVNGLIQKHVDSGRWVGSFAPISWRVVPNGFMDDTTDRYFRDAWKDNGKGKPDIDMPKAREIHKEKLRTQRQPLLDALDLEYMQADERGDQQGKRGIAQRKQTLRDVTQDPRIAAAQTPEDLRAITLG